MSKATDLRLDPTPYEAGIENSLRPLVAAVRDLLEAAGPAFLRDWRRI